MSAWAVPADLAWVLDEADQAPTLYLMHVPDGEPLVLAGTGALIWLFAAQGDDVVESLREVITDPPSDLAETTHTYLTDLVSRGLLVEVAVNAVQDPRGP